MHFRLIQAYKISDHIHSKIRDCSKSAQTDTHRL